MRTQVLRCTVGERHLPIFDGGVHGREVRVEHVQEARTLLGVEDDRSVVKLERLVVVVAAVVGRREGDR